MTGPELASAGGEIIGAFFCGAVGYRFICSLLGLSPVFGLTIEIEEVRVVVQQQEMEPDDAA